MVKWIQLTNFMCPSCPSRGGNDWVCNVDRGPVYLSEEGVMKCYAGYHTGKVVDWRWNCGSDYHKGEFLESDFEGFTFAMSQAVQLTGRAGADWVATLLHNVGKQ